MGKFTWKDNATIDFGDGVTFEVPNDTGFVKETVLKANDAVQAVVDKKPDDDKACINALLDAIDKILGDSATGKIFSGHKLNLCNTMNAYIFIVDEILTQLTGYEDMLDELKQKSGKLNALPLPAVNAEALAAANEKLAELGITPTSVPSKAEAALRPRL